MIRKIKVMGLSCVAVLALGAMSASAAQSASWDAEKTPASITATSAAISHWTMGNGARVISCASKHTGLLPSTKFYIDVTPEYSGCTSTGGLPATITANGCTFAWTPTSVTTGTQTINCPVGEQMTFNVYANATKQKEGITACEATIAAQGPLNGLGFSNQGAGKERYVAMTTNISIKANALKGSKLLCGAAAGESFWISNSANLNATGSDSWGAVGIFIAK